MIQTASQYILVTAPSWNPRVQRNIWAWKSARGEALWAWISCAFTAYWILFVAGAFLNHRELNAIGGLIILAVLGWVTVERLWVSLDGVVIASMAAAAALPLVQAVVSSPPAFGALSKHISLCLAMAMSRVLLLPKASTSRMRGVLAGQVLVILLISLTIFKGGTWDGGTRHSGLFVNPNNLALIPFLLLFFVDLRRDKWFIRVGAHAVVIAVLIFSATSGAVLAYAIGLTVHLSSSVSKTFRWVASIVAVLIVAAGIAFIAMEGERFLPQTRLVNQISVMRTELKDVISGVDIAYYRQEKVLGSGTASGIWRLAHWRKTVATYFDGTIAQQIFGVGIGSSVRVLGVLPHNEYLRMLFEQGLVGLLLFLFAWKRIITTAPVEVRYIGLIIAIYSFSENNLDNFPFMALFILCLSARGVAERCKADVGRFQLAHGNARPQQA
jgi:hypothetical protein